MSKIAVTSMTFKSDRVDSSDDDDEVGTAREQWADYADGTSIHGIKYTCEKGRPGFERYVI